MCSVSRCVCRGEGGGGFGMLSCLALGTTERLAAMAPVHDVLESQTPVVGVCGDDVLEAVAVSGDACRASICSTQPLPASLLVLIRARGALE